MDHLRSRGLSVLVVKHIGHKDFSIDSDGKDTHVIRKRSGKVVYYADSGELGLIMSNVDFETALGLIRRLKDVLSADVIVYEGFRRSLGCDERVGKIVCVRSLEEVKHFSECRGVLAYVTYCDLPPSSNIIKLPEERAKLMSLVDKHVDYELKVRDALSRLPGLNCGECGFEGCEDLAREVASGRADLTRCKALSAEEKVVLKVNGSAIPMNRFVQRVISNVLVALARSLKGVPEDVRRIEMVVERTS